MVSDAIVVGLGVVPLLGPWQPVMSRANAIPILSASVLAVVEGSCLGVDEPPGFPKVRRSSRLDPSTAASTPALRILVTTHQSLPPPDPIPDPNPPAKY